MVPISTHFHFKVSPSILVRATKYSARLSTIPLNILGISFVKRCMLPNPSLNADVSHAWASSAQRAAG